MREGATRMQANVAHGKLDEVNRRQVSTPCHGEFPEPQCPQPMALDPDQSLTRAQASTASVAQPNRIESVFSLDGRLSSRTSGFVLPKSRTIAISIIAGPSRGLTHRLVKPVVSIGRSGGGADIEIDEPAASQLHCVVGVKEDTVRLCDLGSSSGTYVNDVRVCSADLNHLSEFNVGSSLLVVTILPSHVAGD